MSLSTVRPRSRQPATTMPVPGVRHALRPRCGAPRRVSCDSSLTGQPLDRNAQVEQLLCVLEQVVLGETVDEPGQRDRLINQEVRRSTPPSLISDDRR